MIVKQIDEKKYRVRILNAIKESYTQENLIAMT